MLAFNILAFKRLISGTTPVTSGDQFAKLLGMADKIALQVVIDQVSRISTTFTLALEHSNDGIVWFQVSATPEINGVLLGAPPVVLTAFANTMTRLELTRFTITLGGATGCYARVRVYVTGRETYNGKMCVCPTPKVLFPKKLKVKKPDEKPAQPSTAKPGT
jgi:hypothetical protein